MGHPTATTLGSDSAEEVGVSTLINRLTDVQQPELMKKSFVDGQSPEELRDVYDKWATQYQQDTDRVGYVAPANVTAVFRRHAETAGLNPETAKVLDIGCGTGLAAVHLMMRTDAPPFKNLHGLDYSQGMLDLAKSRPYVSLQQGNLMATLDIEDNSFDAVLGVGTFTAGNVGPSAMEQLLRITRPHGIVCVSIQEHVYMPEDYPSHIKALTDSGKCRVVEIEKVPTMLAVDTHAMVVTFEVLA